MTIREEIELITEILQEKGLGENDEAILQEKIKLLEKVIADPALYKEFDHLPTWPRYEALKQVASKINESDVQLISNWKIPIEKKIDECQKTLNDTAPAQLEDEMKRQKKILYAGIIGQEKANMIIRESRSSADELERLQKAANKVDSISTQVIESWDLTQEQRDYIFIQNILSKILNEKNPQITGEEMNKFLSIKEGVESDDKKTSDSSIRKEMKSLLKSSTVRLVVEAWQRRATVENAQEKANYEMQQEGLGAKE